MNKPFLKWAGRKTQLVDTIIPMIDSSKILVEPFVGSGAIFLNSTNQRVIINDLNNDLIVLYNYLINDDNFIGYVETLFKTYNLTHYTAMKTEFNTTKNKRRKSALFVWLNRHCFNGLCRYNLSGEFNVPVGRYDTIYFPKTELELFRTLVAAKTITLLNMKFEHVMLDFNTPEHVIYCDPPYIPISTTSAFTNYTSTEFNIYDQKMLNTLSKALTYRGVTTIISNSKCQLTEEIFIDADSFSTVNVHRSIGSKNASRGTIEEYIMIYNGVTDE